MRSPKSCEPSQPRILHTHVLEGSEPPKIEEASIIKSVLVRQSHRNDFMKEQSIRTLSNAEARQEERLQTLTSTLDTLKLQRQSLLLELSKHFPLQKHHQFSDQTKASVSDVDIHTTRDNSNNNNNNNNQTYLPSRYAHTLIHHYNADTPQPPLPRLTLEDEEYLLTQARAVVKGRIQHLQDYNEVRDVAQSLIGLVAEARGVRIRDCMDEFGVPEAGD